MAAAALAAAISLALLAAASTARAHSEIPTTWWLDEPTALAKVRKHEIARWDSRDFEAFSGRCKGLAPRAQRSGRAVYKHFACSARVRLNGVNFTFLYRVHVIGPRGRVAFGG